VKTKHSQNPKQKTNIPLWMLKGNGQYANIQKQTNFLIKTVKELSSIMQNEILSEKFVKSKGYLQMINPLIKLLTLLVFILICSLTKSLITLILLGFITVSLAKLSALNLKDYFKRIWIILPLLVFVFSIPASTSLFSKGVPLFYIYKGLNLNIAGISLPTELYISFSGLIMILKMSLRIGVSVSFAYLLIMTTRWSSITHAFSVLRVPPLIVTIFNMTYRYIFILSKIAAEMMEARFLRTVGSTGGKSNRSFMASRMSILFIKANFLSDEIYNAMRCRGFCGEGVSLYKFKIGKADLLWIANNILILIVLFLGELLT